MKTTNNGTTAHDLIQTAGSVDSARGKDVVSDGIDRRNFLSCMAWAGTGLLWEMAGGVPTSKLFAATFLQ
jgi:Icc protein